MGCIGCNVRKEWLIGFLLFFDRIFFVDDSDCSLFFGNPALVFGFLLLFFNWLQKRRKEKAKDRLSTQYEEAREML